MSLLKLRIHSSIKSFPFLAIRKCNSWEKNSFLMRRFQSLRDNHVPPAYASLSPVFHALIEEGEAIVAFMKTLSDGYKLR